MYNFVCEGKSRIKKEILVKKYEEGGLGMLDIEQDVHKKYTTKN